MRGTGIGFGIGMPWQYYASGDVNLILSHDFTADGTGPSLLSAKNISPYTLIFTYARDTSHPSGAGNPLFARFGPNSGTIRSGAADYEYSTDGESAVGYGDTTSGFVIGGEDDTNAKFMCMHWGMSEAIPTSSRLGYYQLNQPSPTTETGQSYFDFKGTTSGADEDEVHTHMSIEAGSAMDAQGAIYALGIGGSVVASDEYDIDVEGATQWPFGTEIDLTDCDFFLWGCRDTNGSDRIWEFGTASTWDSGAGAFTRHVDPFPGSASYGNSVTGMRGPITSAAWDCQSSGWAAGFGFSNCRTFGYTNYTTEGGNGAGNLEYCADTKVHTRIRLDATGVTRGKIWYVKLNLGLEVVGEWVHSVDGSTTDPIPEFSLEDRPFLIYYGIDITDTASAYMEVSDGTYRNASGDWLEDIDPVTAGTPYREQARGGALVGTDGGAASGSCFGYMVGHNVPNVPAHAWCDLVLNGTYATHQMHYFDGGGSSVDEHTVFTAARVRSAANVTGGEIAVLAGGAFT